MLYACGTVERLKSTEGGMRVIKSRGKLDGIQPLEIVGVVNAKGIA